MRLIYLAFFTLAIVLNLFGQKSILESREESQGFKKYISKIDNIDKHKWDVLNKKEKQSLAATTLWARIKNPHEVFLNQKNNSDKKDKNYLIADRFFTENEEFKKNINNKNNYLYDIYFSPFIMIGEIIKVKIIKEKESPDKNPLDKIIIYQYTMMVKDNLNPYTNISKGDTVKFLFPTGHRFWSNKKYTTDSELTLGKTYLVFLNDITSNYGLSTVGCLPTLRITKKGDEGFLVVGSRLKDPNNYFTDTGFISLTDAKKTIVSNLNEILTWKED